jgi:hypothetical protein
LSALSRLKSIRRTLLIGVVGLAVLAVYTWAMHDVFTTKVPGASDWARVWLSARMLLSEGLSPYSDEATLRVQEFMFGGGLGPSGDRALFAYPLYAIWTTVPYTIFNSYAWAQAAWQVSLQVAVIAGLFLLLNYYRWRPSPTLLGATIFWMIFYYPTARGIILGQIGMVLFLFIVLALWDLQRGADWQAGMWLALSTVKPQMIVLLIPFLLVWALRRRRWGLMAGFGGAMIVLAGTSFALVPTWITDWLAQVAQYPGYSPPAVMYIITHEALPLGRLADGAEVALDTLLLIGLLIAWWWTLHADDDGGGRLPARDTHGLTRFDWAVGLTLVVTQLAVLRTATTNYIVFVIPLIAFFRDLEQSRWGAWEVLGFQFVLVAGMWWLFLATVVGEHEHNVVYLPLPLLLLVLLLIFRPDRRATPVQEKSA